MGIWRQVGVPNGYTREPIAVVTDNYKVINSDKTFYTFVARDNISENSVIGQYGTYKITSDSILIETAVKHVLTPSHTGKVSTLNYRLIDKNTLMISWKYDDTRDAKKFGHVLKHHCKYL